jgi:Cytochrome c554 and c-prime
MTLTDTHTIPPPVLRGRGLCLYLVLGAVLVVAGIGAPCLARLLAPPIGERMPSPANPAVKQLLPPWPKPDLVLVLSAQTHGYLSPCGCSRPQVGGLERRYNLIQALKENGWSYAAFDLGDLPQERGPASLPNVQGLIKYRYGLKALKLMNYSAVSFGAFEGLQPLTPAIDDYGSNDSAYPTLVVANVLDAERIFPATTIPAVKLVDPRQTNGIRVAATAVISPVVAEEIKRTNRGAPQPIRFEQTAPVLTDALKEMRRQNVELPVLLYQGPPDPGPGPPQPSAAAAARVFPQFPIVLSLCRGDEPPSRPEEVITKTRTKSWIVTVGTKGKHIGLVGVWRTGKPEQPFEFRYKMIELTEDYLTPEDKRDDHPIVKLLNEYTSELKTGEYLSRHYAQAKHLSQVLPPVAGVPNPGGPDDPSYVGSNKCISCHKQAYKVWAGSRHSHAYQTLVDAQHPSNRQYDPECIVCHTVGFGFRGGFMDEKRTPLLKDVGCESCHGPGSLHVKNHLDPTWQSRMNPWKLPETATAQDREKMKLNIDRFCQQCHDIENDVTWIHNGFKTKWPKIAHPEK